MFLKFIYKFLFLGAIKKVNINLKKVIPMVLSACMGMPFVSGCENKSSSDNSYDLYIFSSKGEITSQFEELCQLYEKDTGVKIKLQQIGSGTEHKDTLRIQMNSSNKPGIYSLQGLRELYEYEMSGSVIDLNNASSSEFKALADAVPQNLRLTSDGKNNFGIPYNIEGYGYIVDKQMVADLIGAENVEAFVKDMKAASYEEFGNFVVTLSNYIKNSKSQFFALNKNIYNLNSSKIGLAKNLTGVFSVAGSEPWTFGDHMMNIALNAVFKSSSDFMNANDSQIDAMKSAFTKYLRALDLKTSYAAGDNEELRRGAQFINVTSNDYNKAIQRFAEGKALFIKQGNWILPNIEKINPQMLNRLMFLPVKMPISAEDVKCDGMTVEKLNSSIPVYVPNYFVINPKVSEREQKLAQDFLVWLNTSETAQDFVINKFGFIPYNAKNDLVLKSSLNNSILEYQREGKTLAAIYHGAPEAWSKEAVSMKIMESLLTKGNWSSGDMESISNFAAETYKQMKLR